MRVVSRGQGRRDNLVQLKVMLKNVGRAKKIREDYTDQILSSRD